MTSEMEKEEVRTALRIKLNEEKVKLWLPPYTTEDGNKGISPQELVTRYSAELGQTEDVIMDYLEELRCHALEKLAAKKKFEADGLALLKIKLAGKVPDDYTGERRLNLEHSLTLSGLDLKEKISSTCNIKRDRLKLITGGHIIDDVHILSSQNVKNNSTILAICLSETEAEARGHEDQVHRLQQARAAAELLASKEDGGENDAENYYLQIADQSGKPLDLPKEERKALVLAMTLHEKGKTLVRKKEYGEGLIILLEADKEFKKCRSSILDAVDNYALVCLDIVWCYLCLKNVSDLPDAASRLQSCDECFRKSYGPNLERLALVKGGTGTEKALFMRLHLLQGILAYHQQRKDEAHMLLSRAESELKLLVVDEDQMTQVMSMGFTQQEARLGLRLCEGNVQLAVSHIVKRREEKKEIKEKEREKRRKRRIEVTLGKTAKGDNVNVEHYDHLLSMGFSKGAASEALRQADNDIMQAIQVLHENPELLSLPDPGPPQFNITDQMMSQVVAMGFDEQSAHAALNQFKDVQQAIEELLKSGGFALPEWIQEIAENISKPGTSADATPTQSSEEKQREKELIDSIIPDISKEEEEHLDLTLEEEQQFLVEYQAYLRSTLNT